MSCTTLREQVRRLQRDLAELKDKFVQCEKERDTAVTAAIFLKDICWANQWPQLKQAEARWPFLQDK